MKRKPKKRKSEAPRAVVWTEKDIARYLELKAKEALYKISPLN